MIKRTKLILAISLVFLFSTPVIAEISADEAARLGADLTPLGGEKAGNADDTIPAWDGGINQPPAGYQTGKHYVDPFAGDSVLFTITAGNMGQYADKLTEGHKALLKTYGTYKMNVYLTRRSAAAPQRIYDATKQVATTARLTPDGNGVEGAVIGIPFPLPSEGLHVIWNHLLRWRTDFVERSIVQAAPTRSGDYTLVQFYDKINVAYSREGMTTEQLNNILLYFKQEVKSPARRTRR